MFPLLLCNYVLKEHFLADKVGRILYPSCLHILKTIPTEKTN